MQRTSGKINPIYNHIGRQGQMFVNILGVNITDY